MKRISTSQTHKAFGIHLCQGVIFDTFLTEMPLVRLPYASITSGTSVYYWYCSFTGKERDEETGYGYFGARYMDHELMTMWLSVDPMADKYPSISPYAYCAWNPVKLVDPDGREFGKTYDKITGEMIHDDHINDGKVYLGTKRDGSDREYLTQENCIIDMSDAFDKQLEETRDYFQQSAKAYDEKPSSDMFTCFTGKVHKLENFRKLVTDGAEFDLKAKGVFSESNLSKNDGKGYAFCHGKLLRYDDFGNYNYGVAAKAYGLPEFVATAGAGVNQLVKGIQEKTPVFLNNVRGLGDDPRDTEMIHQGYNHKF